MSSPPPTPPATPPQKRQQRQQQRQQQQQKQSQRQGGTGISSHGPSGSAREPGNPTSSESDAQRAKGEAAGSKEKRIDTPDLLVNNGSLPELKNACDDRLQEYFASAQGYVQSHRHTDTKLLLGYGSCAVSGALSLYCYFQPVEETVLVTICGILLYFALNGAMILYANYVEKSIIFEGTRTTPRSKVVEKLVIESSTGRYNPVLDLVFRISDFTDSASPVPYALSRLEFHVPFASCFDESGLFVREEFDRKMEESLAAARRAKKPAAGEATGRKKKGKAR